MITFDLNAFNLVIEVANKLYPEMEAKISFVPEKYFKKLLKRWGAKNEDVKQSCGVTMFDDEGKIPVICINASIPCWASVEIIAHEIAHVAAGVDADHGEKWQLEYDKIFTAYSIAHSEVLKMIGE